MTTASKFRPGLATIGRLGAAFGALVLAAPAFAAPLLEGQPTPGAIGLQPPATPLAASAAFFHDAILLPITVAISLFVLGLLTWVVVRFNKKRNPEPARWSHNTPVEVLWTVMPVLMLMFISIFSFRLLFAYHDIPKPDLTVKVTGNQWYWNYEYPDKGNIAFDSIMLKEAEADRRHQPYKLAVDNPMVVPAGKVVKVLITGADVIHAFFVPSFGVQNDAVPGRVNESWFKVDKPGIYYGQCNELCGVDHSFMPIQVEVKNQADFDAWVAAHAKSGSKAAPAAPAGASGPGAPPVQPTTTSPAASAPAKTTAQVQSPQAQPIKAGAPTAPAHG